MKKIAQISVFLPAYNEEDNIKATIASVEGVLKKISCEYEILVVNDGSSDNTGEIVRDLIKRNNKIRLVNHSVNHGYGAAFKTGLYSVRYSYVVQMDSDGQFDFSQVEKFIEKIDQADLIIGYRIARTDSFYRRFMARVLWLADFILFGLDFKDIDCGFKLFKRQILEEMPKLKTESAITVTEFVARAKHAGAKIAQVGVNHYSRSGGMQTGGKPSIIFKASWQGILLWFFLLKEKIWK